MKPAELYNLEKDIGEKENLLEGNPEVAKQLLKRLITFEAELEANSRPAAFVENPTPLKKAP